LSDGAWMDRYLHTTRVGPLFLRRPEVAALVVQALQREAPFLYYDPVVKQEREMERLVACIEDNPVKAGLVAGHLERRSRPGLRAEARSGTLKRAPLPAGWRKAATLRLGAISRHHF